MTAAARIEKSRNNWKKKAVPRGTELREKRKDERRLRQRNQELRVIHAKTRLELEEARTKIGALEAELVEKKLELVSLRSVVSGELALHAVIDSQAGLRTLCVLMVIAGIVSFRSVPRLLGILHPFGWVQVQIPHFTSVIHWSLRAGIAVFKQVSSSESPWLAIIDCSIDVGTRKALVVLRVPIAALAEKQGAIGLDDCECIGLEISSRWNGPLVEATLRKIFGHTGMPRAIIKDRGTDLNKGVELYREADNAKSVWVIDDVGHVAANALKAEFGGRTAFTTFLNIVRKGAARIRQTDLAWLLPPKIRTKGRFQGITVLAEWAGKVLDLMGGQGRASDGTELAALRKAFSGLAQLRVFLENFVETCLVLERFLKIMKQQGLNQAIYVEAKVILTQLPERSQVRSRLLVWLDRQLRVQSRLGIGQLPLLVSSDVIESLFGKFKTIIQRNPQAELNRLLYMIPLLCGKRTGKDIDRALRDCSQLQMLEAIEQTIPTTLRQQRHRILDSGRTRAAVPKTGETLPSRGS
jgi:hypothetical protein